MDKIIGIVTIDNQDNVNLIDMDPIDKENVKIINETLMIKNVIFHKSFFRAIQLCDQNILNDLTKYIYPP